MKKYYLVANIWKFIEAALLIALGIITMVLANNGDFKYVIGLIAAISLIVDGAFNLSSYFFRVFFHQHRTGMVSAVVEIAMGVFIIVLTSQPAYRNLFVDGFALIVALLLIVIGVALFVEGAAKLAIKSKKILPVVVEFVIGAIVIAMGIVALVFLQSFASVILMVCGGFLILAGIVYIVLIVIQLIAAVHKGYTVIEFFESDFHTKDIIKNND